MKLRLFVFLLLMALIVAIPASILAQDEAEIVNEEGGPTVITGELNWTLGFFAQLWTEPHIFSTMQRALSTETLNSCPR